MLRIGEVLSGAGLDDVVMSNMQCAHGLALEGMESAILEDIRERHLALYAEYEKLVCDSASGSPELRGQLEFGDFDVLIPEDF